MRLWMIFVPAAVLGAVNAGYDAWRNGSPRALAEARRECTAILDGKGIDPRDADEVCGCITEKAKRWRRTNRGAEYTLAVHRSLALPCFEGVAARRSREAEFGTFISDPPSSRAAPDADLLRRIEESERRTASRSRAPAPVTPAGTYPAPSRPEGSDTERSDDYGW